MGRNWVDYIAEAKRCLATNGYLLIVETTKSLKGRLSNISDVIKEKGLKDTQMKKEDTSHSLKQENFKFTDYQSI